MDDNTQSGAPSAVAYATDLDALHDRAWMASRILKSEDWIAHNMGKVPHIRIGMTPYFTERLAREFLEASTVRPASGQTERSRRAVRRSR